MQTITLPFDIKASGNVGEYEGYISIIGNKDLGGDIVMPGAFKNVKTTKDGKLRMAYYHDLTKMIGKAELNEDSKGYIVKGQLNMNLSYVGDIYEQMKDGTLDGMSFGYSVNKNGSKETADKDGNIITELHSLTVYEGSVVPFGMNPKAKVTSVKSSDILTIRDFENALREEFGFSKAQAVLIASKGFSALQREVEEPSGIDEIKAVLDKFKF